MGQKTSKNDKPYTDDKPSKADEKIFSLCEFLIKNRVKCYFENNTIDSITLSHPLESKNAKEEKEYFRKLYQENKHLMDYYSPRLIIQLNYKKNINIYHDNIYVECDYDDFYHTFGLRLYSTDHAGEIFMPSIGYVKSVDYNIQDVKYKKSFLTNELLLEELKSIEMSLSNYTPRMREIDTSVENFVEKRIAVDGINKKFSIKRSTKVSRKVSRKVSNKKKSNKSSRRSSRRRSKKKHN